MKALLYTVLAFVLATEALCAEPEKVNVAVVNINAMMNSGNFHQRVMLLSLDKETIAAMKTIAADIKKVRKDIVDADDQEKLNDLQNRQQFLQRKLQIISQRSMQSNRGHNSQLLVRQFVVETFKDKYPIIMQSEQNGMDPFVWKGGVEVVDITDEATDKLRERLDEVSVGSFDGGPFFGGHPAIASPKSARRPPRLYPPAIDANAASNKAIEQYDANKDGVIDGKELEASPGLMAALAQIDTSGKKAIKAAMVAARIKAWQDSKLGRMSIGCTVLHNGKPLAGADVKFVPETFLGEALKTATGRTDQNGVAMISIPLTGRQDPPGVAPGLYRVEITKAGENIPAKYNTQTVFGQEVALDAANIREGIKFKLEY